MSVLYSCIKIVVCLAFLTFIDAKVISMARKYEEFADEYKRVFRIFYINCNVESALCGTLNLAKYPALRVYPPLPIPAFDVQLVPPLLTIGS